MAAAHKASDDPRWDDVERQIRELEDISRRQPRLRRNLTDLDEGIETIADHVAALTQSLDKPRRSALRLSADKLIGAADKILNFERETADQHTPLRSEQLARARSELWLDFRQKLYEFSDDVDDINN